MDRLVSIDLGALYFFQGLRRPWLDPIMAGLTRVGDTPVLSVVTGVAALVFFLLKRRRTALAIAVSGCLALLLSDSVRALVNRPRPEVSNIVGERPNSACFPSGHALGSMAVYGAVGLGLAQLCRRPAARGLVIGLGFFLGFLIGVTRLYLGFHYVFDVVGGWTAGVACALFGHWLHFAFAPAPSGAEAFSPREPAGFSPMPPTGIQSAARGVRK